MSLLPWAFKESNSLTKPESILEFINDTRSPAAFLNDIEEYYDLRETYCKGLWDMADELYEKLAYSDRQLDPTNLQGRNVIPARVYGYVQYLLTQVFLKRPKYLLKPDSARLEDLAGHMEVALNNFIKRPHLRQFRYAGIDCALTGAGWVWVGCEIDKDVAAAARMRRKRIAKAMKDDPALAILGDQIIADVVSQGDSIDLEESAELTYEMDDRVRRQQLYIRHTPHKRMVYDATCSSPDDMLWVGEEQYVLLEAVKKEKLFQNTEGLQPTAVIKGMWKYANANQLGRGRSRFIGQRNSRKQFVAIYPIVAKNGDGTWDKYWFARGHKPFLRIERAQYDLGCPAVPLSWNDRGEKIFAVSDITQGIDTILTEQLLKTRLLDATSREAEDILLYDKDKLKDLESAISDNPDVGLNIGVPGGMGQGIRSVADFLPRQSKVDRLLPYLAILERDYEMAWGMGPNQQLQALRSDTSATESAELARNAQVRMAIKAESAEEFVAVVGKKILQLMAQFFGPEQIEPLCGPEGAKAWQREDFTKSDIQNGLSVEVEVGSMRPETDDSRMQILNMIIQEAMQNPVLAQGWNIMEVQKLRSKIMGVRDGSKIINQSAQNPQMLQGLMQLALSGAQGAKGSAPAARGESNAQAARPGAVQ